MFRVTISMKMQEYKLVFLSALLLVMVSVASCSKKPSATKTTPEKEPAETRADHPKLPDMQSTKVEGDVQKMDASELVQLLGDAAYQRRLEAAEELVSRGDDSLEAIEAGLESENYHVRAGSAFALGMFGDKASSKVEKLEALASNDPRDAVRSAAAFAVDRIKLQ